MRVMPQCWQSPLLCAQVERVRLNYKSASMRRPSREQEVLHYQWFADLGSVEAQRAVGQIFSHGAMRNPEQALRYFRCSQRHLSCLLPPA